jgi:sec-independent protein translocase protein TatA
MSLGIVEILLVFLVFLVMGPRRIVDLLRSLGRGVHDFVDALGRGEKNELPPDENDTDQNPRQ